ncbi:3'(2'),5'-bisphosphate nucleotidase CysQ family protein [Helicobacter turcicus]|uniref:3'(2'),5'-bisphosphate nucleotidase CysQ n=1 Tax=Helicobacter turcicus TaxID=2867412 RepID=A0ABS7JQ11_9HELI|nr:3'(2'),5'-bisphosphate nucleotidase CysQ [Helicobacter turcicus]MBX7491482.1 3'(2'),5'-bisphosphate nucleotidase CysQ [Helicobacter turcicus]MBX7546339.1 3'(2'),5'-bisphosphate nucleotidase CysQ [Helicobacter turcicus]
MYALLYKTALIATNAGEVVLKYYGLEDFDLKKDSSPLTKADLESNALITKALGEISPYALCSEEAVLDYTERKDLEYFWLIDPLDGTKDFLAQNGGFTINIALIHKNRPILGVVYAPYFSKLYLALKGFGGFTFCAESLKNARENNALNLTWLEANKQRLNGDRIIQDTQIVACDSIFHSTRATQDFIKKYALKVQKYGSSLKICALAEGKADLYPRFNGTNEWDIAACEIVLEEAGGVILDCITKKPLLYNKPSVRNNHFIAFAKSQINGEIYKDFMRNG